MKNHNMSPALIVSSFLRLIFMVIWVGCTAKNADSESEASDDFTLSLIKRTAEV